MCKIIVQGSCDYRFIVALKKIWLLIFISSILGNRLVEETLEPLDPDRRAFRLVGGVLVRHN
jgi:hypothetical protein